MRNFRKRIEGPRTKQEGIRFLRVEGSGTRLSIPMVIKRIHVNQLRVGMFISKMKCGWLQHPFLKNSFYVGSLKEIDKLLEHGVYEVYIDTTRGLDVASSQTEAEVRYQLDAELNAIACEDEGRPEEVPIHEEYLVARQIRKEAIETVAEIMRQVKDGRGIETGRARAVVGRMIDSVARNRNALLTLCRIREKHEYTYMHSVSVGALMICFADSIGFPLDDIQAAGLGGLFHDIGKTWLPDALLDKPGPLAPEELALFRTHAVAGRRLLEASGLEDPRILVVAQEHHERYDGSGYPEGLKDSEISTWGQMAAIVDVYDALTSARAYKGAMEPADAVRELYETTRFYFNTGLTEQFIKCVGIYPVGTLVRLENGLLGFVTDFQDGNLPEPLVRIVYDSRKKWFVSPYSIQLSSDGYGKSGARIIGAEDPKSWKIDHSLFFEQPGPSS